MKSGKGKAEQPLTSVVSGVLTGMVMLLIGCAVFAALIGGGKIPEQWLQPIAWGLNAIGFYVACLIAAGRTGKTKLLVSAATAGGMLVLLALLQLLLFQTTTYLPAVTLLIALVMCSTAALTSNKKRRHHSYR